MKNILTATACAVVLAAGVVSADAASTQSTTTNAPAYAAPVINDANAMKGVDQLQHTSLRQQLTNQLEKAGYTQVKVTPSSFFVEAKNKKGEPVAMVIGPDSFAEVTDIPMKTPGPTAQQAPSADTPQK